MLNAIGASIFQFSGSPGQSTAILDGELAQYQRQLADWVNCPSCSTPEGKAKIAEITAKISEVEQGLKAGEASKQDSQRAQADATSAISASRVDVYA